MRNTRRSQSGSLQKRQRSMRRMTPAYIVRFAPEGIRSREANEHVPVWNHDIIMAPVDANHTEYTDRVEIWAGWKTAFIWVWANAFYAHRQRRWIQLLRDGNGCH